MSIASLGRRILDLWAVRLVIVVVALLLAVLLRDILTGILAGALQLGSAEPELWLGRPRSPTTMTVAGAVYALAAFALTVVLGYGAYAWCVRRLERRPPTEIALAGAPRALGVGSLVGIGIVLAAIAVIGIAGGLTIVPSGEPLFAAAALASAATAACMEELVLRGVVLRTLEHWVGTWLALAVTAALFGALHLTNPGATWISALTIALTGGLILGLAYVTTRRLWLAVGLHFGVNATQGALLGLPVSGGGTRGLFATTVTGSDVLTGGPFGVESSLTVLFVGLGVAFLLARRVQRSGQVLPPLWARPREPTGEMLERSSP
jgi:membrane protease YdiL (CAAX protease family)